MQATDIGSLDQIPKGEGRNFIVSDRIIAVFHTQSGEVFATQPRCPHRGGPLADGLTVGATVVCPLHDRTYDLRAGDGVNTDCKIAVYPVHLTEDGRITLELNPNRPETTETMVPL